MAIGINDLMGMMYQDGDIYGVPFTADQLFPVVNRPNNLEMLRRIQEFREPVTLEQVIASLPVAPPVAPPPVISPPDDFGMLRRMQEFRETAPAAFVPEITPVFNPRIIEDDFNMLRRLQEARETVPTVPVAPAEPRISEDVGLVPSRIVGPPFIQRDEVVTSPQLIDRPSLLGPPKEEPSGNTIDFLAKQILGQGTSGWSGEGFGSAEANAKDMARILAEAGITDINQFGVKTVEVPASEQPVMDEGGIITGSQIIPATTRQVYVNKETGQEIMPNYSRAGGNIWSGTFSGKGSTGYGVRFDAQGKPQFYTEYGGTTSDWVPFRENILKPAALAAAAIYGIPLVTEALTGAAAGAAGAGAATAAELAAAAELASAAGTAAGTAGTLGTASAIPNILVTAGKLAPVMTAAEIAALAAPVTAGLLSTPSVTPSVPEPSNVIEVVAPKPAPTITPAEAVAAATPVVPGLLPQPEPIPTLEVTAPREVPREVPQIEEIPVIPPIITSPISIPEVTAQKQMTPKEIMSYVDTALKAAGLLGAGAAAAKEFDIVPVPTDWTSPVYQRQPWQPLPPIDFGTMELLRGTQWERLINPAIQRSSVQTAMPGVMPGQLVQPRSIPTQFVIDQIANQTVPIAPAAPSPTSGTPTSGTPAPSTTVVGRPPALTQATTPLARVAGGQSGLNLYEPGYDKPFGSTPPGSFVVGGSSWERAPEELNIEQLIASLPGSPVAPTVFAPPVISQPDDFGMLRRMQEFRETVPDPQQISADVSLIPQFPQSVGVPLPYMPPQSYTPIGQPMGLKSLIYALSNGQTDASAMV